MEAPATLKSATIWIIILSPPLSPPPNHHQHHHQHHHHHHSPYLIFSTIYIPIAKNTTNISQIYHKYTTKELQNVILYHKNVILYHKNVILYHKTECFTTKCNILPHNVVFFRYNPTTNCSLPLPNIVIYHKMMYYTLSISISPQK